MDIGEYKISKSQVAEIRNLYEQLGWKVSDIENEHKKKLEDFFWLEAGATISGAKLFIKDETNEQADTLL